MVKMKHPHAAFIVALLAGAMTACTGQPNADQQAGEPAAASQLQQMEPAELVIYSSSGWTPEAFNEKFGDALRAKFPQHQIKYIQSTNGAGYQDLITAGQPIDMIWESVAKFPSILQYNIQYDMTELIKKHNVDTSRMEPTMLDAMRTISGGKLYALPVVNNTLSLYYNKDLFDKFGLAYPTDGMTWDQVLDLNKQLTRVDGGIQYVGLGISQSHFFDINPLSLSKMDPNTLMPTIYNDKWKTLFEIYSKMAEASGYKEKIQELQGIPGVTNFVKKKDTAMVAALANMHMTQDMSEVNWDVVRYPVFKDAPNANPQSYPTYFGVSSISKHQDQAMDMIKYLVSDEFQLAVARSGTLPVIQSSSVIGAFAQDAKFKDKNVKSALYSSFAPIAVQTIYDSAVSSAYGKKLVPFSLGQMDVNTLLRTSEEEAAKTIESLKVK
ncbi:extracellular solute-binding protein [Paenibacillus sp. H1-7]|uniref:ABC transporter substrate-binding protein n=1 Tax=Paenibacillus sp. H1-7 TaxID=2282849 RepID=UPI001EF94145|nr:extracellular solute-binding protein [Paenibacillus sp. H1-7]ULL16319.1 extracellular solute-binding protein [Paenibacillus sp. H1-7]